MSKNIQTKILCTQCVIVTNSPEGNPLLFNVNKRKTTPPAEQMFWPVGKRLAAKKRTTAKCARLNVKQCYMKATTVLKKSVMNTRAYLSALDGRTLVPGWWCILMMQSQTHSASNLQRCGLDLSSNRCWGGSSPGYTGAGVGGVGGMRFTTVTMMGNSWSRSHSLRPPRI